MAVKGVFDKLEKNLHRVLHRNYQSYKQGIYGDHGDLVPKKYELAYNAVSNR